MINRIRKVLKYLSPAHKYEQKPSIIKSKSKIGNEITEIFNSKKNNEIIYKNFGNLNPEKSFLIIQQTSLAGFFSNFNYVLNCLKLAESKNLIPIVDMENFPNLYNENQFIYNTNNSWLYYFDQVSDYSLEEIYKSKNVYFTSGVLQKNMKRDSGIKDNIVLIKNYIKINSRINDEIKSFQDEFIKNKKVLGILFRGQNQRFAARHALPPSIKQMFNRTSKLLDKNSFDKIFLCTDEQLYLDKFKEKFGDMVVCYDSLRSYNENRMLRYTRNLHRYNLGKEVLIEMKILSECSMLLGTKTNVTENAKLFSLLYNKDMEVNYIDNGRNYANPFLRRWNWHVRSLLPTFLGGFKL